MSLGTRIIATMPTYVYETVPSDGSEPRCFEIQQRMSDAALIWDPETGEAVRRIPAGGVGIITGSGSDMVPCASGGCMLPRELAEGGGPCGAGSCGI